MKILVACCTLRSIDMEPYLDHTMLWYALGRKHPEIEFHQLGSRRMSIDNFRNFATRVAIEQGFDYIFFIDDDMQFEDPRTAFSKLYESTRSGYDFVCAMNYIRGYPFKLMAFKWDLAAPGSRLVNLIEKDLPDPLVGTVPCVAFGTAVCLLRVEPLWRTPAPWFITGPHGTEDIYMCLRVASYYKDLKLGLNVEVITGHRLDCEVISHRTREAHMIYHESFMAPEDVAAARMELRGIAEVPKIPKGREVPLTYEELMGVKFGNDIGDPVGNLKQPI